MNPKDVADSTGISLNTVYKHLKSRDLKGFFDGTRWFIDARDVIEWAEWNLERGRCSQYPLIWTSRFIDTFGLWR